MTQSTTSTAVRHSHRCRSTGALALGVMALVTLPNAAPLLAQATGVSSSVFTPTVGSWVRVTLPPTATGKRPRVVGTLRENGPDSLRVERPTGETVSVARQDVGRLELSLGRHRPVVSDMGKGALIGGLGLGVLTALTYQDESCRAECYGGYDWRISRGEAGLFAGIAGVIGGAFWGSVVGVLRKTDRWYVVSAPATAHRIEVAPRLGRTRGVHVALIF